MIKGKHFDHGFEGTRNGPDGAGATEYRLSIVRRCIAKLLLGIALTLTNKMTCVVREFD
jgi:hypothetical protein